MSKVEIQKINEEQVRRLNRLIDRGSVKRLKRLYERAQADLTTKLSRRFGRNANTFTTGQMQMFQGLLRQGQMALAQELGETLSSITEETKADALRGMIRDFKKLERKFTGLVTTLPIEEASIFEGVLGKNRSLLRQHSIKLMGKNGVRIVRKVERELALSLSTGETVGDAIDRVQKITGKEWWQAERIVRTEQAWAFNATHAEGIKESAKELPDMRMRWTELVSDATGAPLDDRVGEDSIAMHGQVALPGGKFTMPVVADVSASLWGKSWDHPPNRPNDRATLQPWRPHWGIPGWELRSGRRRTVAAPKK